MRGQRGVGEELPLGRGTASRQEDLGESGLVGENAATAGPGAGDDLGHRHAFTGVRDRRREDLSHRQAAEAAVQLEPAVDGARYGPGVRRV